MFFKTPIRWANFLLSSSVCSLKFSLLFIINLSNLSELTCAILLPRVIRFKICESNFFSNLWSVTSNTLVFDGFNIILLSINCAFFTVKISKYQVIIYHTCCINWLLKTLFRGNRASFLLRVDKKDPVRRLCMVLDCRVDFFWNFNDCLYIVFHNILSRNIPYNSFMFQVMLVILLQ